jgi:hypothetical protein
MSIGVYCEECEKTYQVRDELAGRKGKCPRNHPIEVPLADASSVIVQAPAAPAPAPEAEFAFSNDARFSASDDDEDDYSAPKTKRRRPARIAQDPEPDPTPTAAGDDFSFPTPSLIGGDDEDAAPAPKTGRHRKPEPKSVSKIHKAGKAATGKPNMMPLYLGGILAVLGVGGGATMLIMSRGEAGPLRAQAEEANKKAKDAEEKLQTAKAETAAKQAEFDKLKSTPPPKDAAMAKDLKDAQTKLALAKAQIEELQKAKPPGDATAVMPAKTPELDPSAPGGKDDPVMPRGKLGQPDPKMEPKKDPKMPAGKVDPKMPKVDPKKPVAMAEPGEGAPMGGKNWAVQPGLTFGMFNFNAGEKLWLYPKEDAVLKVEGGRVLVKFRWQLVKEQKLPESAMAALLVLDGQTLRLAPAQLTLSGNSGDVEASFDVAMVKAKGQLPVYLFVSEGPLMRPTIHSTILTLQANFGMEKN